MSNQELEKLRARLDELNFQILDLLSERGQIAMEIGKVKARQSLLRFDPVRERKMLDVLKARNNGPFDDVKIEQIFKQIFQASLDLQSEQSSDVLLVSRKKQVEDTIISLKHTTIGQKNKTHIFGPCAVESYEQVAAVAKKLKAHGFSLLRGGAFKPRTSPYDFQGLGMEGLKILRCVADAYDLSVVSEVVNTSDLAEAVDYLDVIQIGARNMQNFDLLKAAGRIRKPILLKRGLSATIEEFILAAEYILAQGNQQVILCERGIRTFERATRNTLDITAVPILKQETHLPVLVDVAHSTGRRDLLLPAAKAALAIGADGVIAEVHPDPAIALSDAQQQMNFEQFDAFATELQCFNNSQFSYNENEK